MNRCSKCPEFKWMVLQVALIAFGIFSLICILLREDKKTKKTGRTLADVLLARLKIVIGFYQVSIEIIGINRNNRFLSLQDFKIGFFASLFGFEISLLPHHLRVISLFPGCLPFTLFLSPFLNFCSLLFLSSFWVFSAILLFIFFSSLSFFFPFLFLTSLPYRFVSSPFCPLSFLSLLFSSLFFSLLASSLLFSSRLFSSLLFSTLLFSSLLFSQSSLLLSLLFVSFFCPRFSFFALFFSWSHISSRRLFPNHWVTSPSITAFSLTLVLPAIILLLFDFTLAR